MAGHGGGGPDDDKHLPEDPLEHRTAGGGRGATQTNDDNVEGEGTLDGKGQDSQNREGVKLAASVDTSKKRLRYLRKLESIVRKLEEIVDAPENAKPIRIMAMNSMTKNLIQCYQIMKDANLEALENELKNFEEEIRKIKRSQAERRVEFVPDKDTDT